MAADMFKRPRNEPINGDTPSRDDFLGSTKDVESRVVKATATVWPLNHRCATGDGAVVQIGEDIAVCASCRSLMISPSSDWEWGLRCGTCNDSESNSE